MTSNKSKPDAAQSALNIARLSAVFTAVGIFVSIYSSLLTRKALADSQLQAANAEKRDQKTAFEFGESSTLLADHVAAIINNQVYEYARAHKEGTVSAVVNVNSPPTGQTFFDRSYSAINDQHLTAQIREAVLKNVWVQLTIDKVRAEEARLDLKRDYPNELIRLLDKSGYTDSSLVYMSYQTLGDPLEEKARRAYEFGVHLKDTELTLQGYSDKYAAADFHRRLPRAVEYLQSSSLAAVQAEVNGFSREFQINSVDGLNSSEIKSLLRRLEEIRSKTFVALSAAE